MYKIQITYISGEIETFAHSENHTKVEGELLTIRISKKLAFIISLSQIKKIKEEVED